MGPKLPLSTPVRAFVVVLVAVLIACDAPKPSASPAGPMSTDTRPAKVVGDLALEACDPEGLLPCEHQALVLADPIAASGLALTYSTEWADGRLDRPTWNADALGLGGWSLDLLHRYDPERGILLGGDGSWRSVAAVDVGGGARAVPTFDGLRYFVFDGAWRHVRTVDALTGASVLTIAYDDSGRLESIRGPGAGTPIELTVERDAGDALVGVVGLGGTGTGLVTDGDGRLVAIGRPDGTFLQLAYEAFGLVSRWDVTGRGIYRYEWDDVGRMRLATDPDDVSHDLTLDRAGGAVSVAIRDPNGGTATHRAERAGEVLRRTFTDTDGTVTQLETRSDGSTRLVEADGTVTTTGAVPHPRWALAAPILTPIVETRPDGTEYRVETATTMGTGSPEPAGGAWETVTTIGGERWVDAYEPRTRVLTSTDPERRVSTRTFDAEGRVTEERVPGQPVVASTYGANGLLATQTIGEGANAATTAFTYGGEAGGILINRGDTTSVTGVLNGFGDLGRVATADENLALTRDPARAILQLRAGAHPATSFGYSDAGRPTAFIPPVVGDDAWYELTTYTAAGQVATIGDPSGPRLEFDYDQAGRVRSWTFDRGTSTTTYAAQSGLLESTTAPGGVTTSFAYDGWVPTGIAWAGPVTGEVRLDVDELLQASSQTVNGGDRIDFGYDAGGLLTSVGDLVIERDPQTGLPSRTTLGGLVTTSSYDAAGRLAGTITTSGGETVLSVAYVRDPAGRITGVERTDAGGATTSMGFGYDGTGRLSSFRRGDITARYLYDATGNRVSTDPGTGATTASTFDDRDRIVTQGVDVFRHSPDGPLLEREGTGGTTHYDFDDLGALRSVRLPSGKTLEYVLDAGGRRIGRMVDGALTEGYLYGVDDTIAALTDGSGAVVARFAYDYQGRLVLVQRDGRELLVVTDQLGSPIALLDRASGEVVEQIAYDAWGNVVAGGASKLVPFGFAGGLLDRDTGLVHFGARDYDPTTGRWTAPDPLRYGGGDINLYRYAMGDPMNLVDPTGTTACAGQGCRGASPDDPQPEHAAAAGRRGTGGSGAGAGGRTGRSTATPRNTYNDAGSPARPSRDVAGPRATPPVDNSGTTVCFSGPCVGPDGVTGAAPGNNASADVCIGICFPIPGGLGGCLFACGGTSDRGTFICLIACGFGEPHIITGDGGHVDFQVAGEFVIARSPDGALEIQGRFETPPNVTTVTRVTALAMHVGSDRVAFYADPQRPLVINGEAVDRADYAVTLAGGGVVERHGTSATVAWPDGSVLGVNVYASFVNFGFNPSEAVAPSMAGVVGSHDGERANDLTTRDGTVIDPAGQGFRELLHDRFADSWRISQDESLFDYRTGESTTTFQRPEIPSEYVTAASLDPAIRTAAEALCRAMGIQSDPILSDCILDVGLTGDPTYAASAATAYEAQERASVRPLDLGTAVERNQLVSGNLSAGAIDRYHFTAAAGDVVYLDADVACGPNVDWQLFQPNGVLVAFADVCADLGRSVLAEAGEWRLDVRSDDGVGGPYAFRVITVPEPQEWTIAPGASAAATTSVAGEWHRYALTATAGQVVYLDATGDCASPMSWRLLDPDGALVDFQTACTDLGRKVLADAGVWVIEVYSDDLRAGSYAFSVIAAPTPTERPIDLGQTVSGAISQVGEWHRYRLTAEGGQVIYAEALGACQAGLSWRLLDPDGVLTTFQTTCTDIGRRVLNVAGDWVIEVYSDELATGRYSFRLVGAPAVRTFAIRTGGSANGAIASAGEWHRYALMATAGQRIVIDARGECIPDLWWRLLEPDGTLTTFASICTDSDVRTLDVAGDWVIEVYSDTMATGPYAFTVNAAR